MLSLRLRLLFLVLICFVAGSSLADQVEINLSTAPGTACGMEWIDGPCVLWFEAITAEDYQPVNPPQLVCFPFQVGTDLYLMPARLCVNLTGVSGIESIEVDLAEGAEMHATRVMAYLGDIFVKEVTSFQMGSHTVTLPVTPGTFDTLVISGWETGVTYIRLVGTALVDDHEVGFGTVKALYR